MIGFSSDILAEEMDGWMDSSQCNVIYTINVLGVWMTLCESLEDSMINFALGEVESGKTL